jgi:TPR repeat protein
VAARAPCEGGGTLGIEARPISRQLRKKLKLPDNVRGAAVAQVLPDGPAAAADIRPDDIVQDIGAARIGNDCDFADAAYNRSCDPVRVLLWRGGAAVEAKLVPVMQEPFFDRLCRAGVAAGCFRPARSVWSRTREGDRDRAFGLYQNACVTGSAEACAEEGLRFFKEKVDRAQEAVVALQRSCDIGSGAGCTHLAFLYATGSGALVKKDDRRATPLYVKGCDLGDALGCYNAGLMSDEGRGVARDHSRAAARYEEACEMGSSAACTNLGFLYENGRGVGKDRARAVALYQRGCDGTSCQRSNLNGCVNVGRAYRDGIGVEKNAARAASVFQEACNRKPDPEDVNPEENRSRACSLLGALYLAGDGIATDLTKGRELSELGCERGDSFGCFNAAAVFAAGTGIEKDAAKAATFLDKACRGGDGEGCHDLGAAYEKGTGVARDRRRAADLYRKACELGFQPACAKKVR